MKIIDVVCSGGRTGFYFDDQRAIKGGAGHDGVFYVGAPVTEGFRSVRQAGESISVMLVLEDGQVAYGDCAAVQYSGAGGRDPLFLAEDFIPVIDKHIKPQLVGKEANDFRGLCAMMEAIEVEGKRYERLPIRTHLITNEDDILSLINYYQWSASGSFLCENFSLDKGSKMYSQQLKDMFDSVSQGNIVLFTYYTGETIKTSGHAVLLTGAYTQKDGTKVLVAYDCNRPEDYTSKALLLIAMLAGSCASSAGGGIKIVRWLLILKIMKSELAKILHPKAIYNIKVGRYSVSKDVLYQTLMFVSFYIAILVVSGFIIAILEQNTTVGISSAVSALGNIGPGIGKIIGPLAHYDGLHEISKFIIIIDMYIGRLELIPFLVLFQKNFWNFK